MAKKSTHAPLSIALTIGQLQLFESFLQYGDLAHADLIFMGMEEGLDGGSYPHLNINQLHSLANDARRELLTNSIFAPNRVFLNGINEVDGWYINDSGCLKHAQCIVLGIPYVRRIIRQKQTITMQARLHWLLQNNNCSTGYNLITKQDFPAYPNLHNSLSKAAMIDFLPLPNQGANVFPYTCPPLFTDRITYERHYHTLNSAINNRYKILENAYNSYPMKVSVSYTGIKNGKFKLEDFYISLGFNFTRLNTGTVNPRFSGYIKPSPGKRDFLRGERIKKNGDIQIAILTPFFGMGQLLKTDIDVISTWV